MATDLQDFRREREGVLLIRGDRPFLVISFGTRYTGPDVNKYKVEGKYHIPVGFKVIVKWDDDEIVFMTRQGSFAPEYQMIYLPKSALAEDFTLFEWNSNIAEIWDQLLTVLETQDKDMSMFTAGPWHTFGITDETVQTAVEKNADERTLVTGILYCANGKEPTDQEIESYLGFNPETDDAYRWVVREFKNDPLPVNVFQYVSNGMCYWVRGDTQESTWEHPHYAKYTKLLATARIQRPQAQWKAIQHCQIEFLFSQLFDWECEATGKYPPVETVENTIELARIFRVNIQEEPYYVHVLKLALRHYAEVVKAKRAVSDVDDFRALMQRYRSLVTQFECTKNAENTQVRAILKCVECNDDETSEKREAVLFCDACQDLLCQACFDRLHAKGRRRNHRRTWIELGVCGECDESLAVYHCVSCQDAYCAECFSEWHMRGGRRNHIPIILRSFNKHKQAVPAVEEFEDGRIPAASITMGSSASHNYAKAMSPWVQFEDESSLPLYYNVHTGERRRDLPLALLNEPIEKSLGGGLGGSWAGTLVGDKDDYGGMKALPGKAVY